MCSRPAVSTSTRSAPRLDAGGHRVEHDRAGIGAFLPAHELAAGALGPQLRADRPPRRGTCRPPRARRGGRRRPAATRACRSSSSCRRRSRRRTSTRSARPATQVQRRDRRSPSRIATTSSRTQTDQLVGLGDRRRPWPRSRTASSSAAVVGMPDVGEQHRLFELVPGLVVDLAAAHTGRTRRRTRRACGRAGRAAAASRRLGLGELLELSGVAIGVDLGTTSGCGVELLDARRRRRRSATSRGSPATRPATRRSRVREAQARGPRRRRATSDDRRRR